MSLLERDIAGETQGVKEIRMESFVLLHLFILVHRYSSSHPIEKHLRAKPFWQ